MILSFRPLNSWLKLGVVLTTCCDEQNFEQPGNKTSNSKCVFYGVDFHKVMPIMIRLHKLHHLLQEMALNVRETAKSH